MTIRRLSWLAAALALTAFAIFEAVVHHLGPLPIMVFAVLPDLAFLAAGAVPHEPGQLPSRAVPAYNLAHRLVIPVVLVAVALAILLILRLSTPTRSAFEAARLVPLIAYTSGVTWLAHIAWDRAFGFGLRTPDGWQRGDPRSKL